MNKKHVYLSPKIDVVLIKLEDGIAAGSALIATPLNSNNEIIQEWETDPDDTRTINWQ